MKTQKKKLTLKEKNKMQEKQSLIEHIPNLKSGTQNNDVKM